LAEQTEQDAPQLERVTHATVTDAAHPLFGQTLEVVKDSSSRGKTYLTLRLPDGQHRAVPRRSTSFEADQSMSVPQTPLPRISARTILPVAQFVRRKLLSVEDKSDGPSDPRVPEDPGREQSANALAAIRPTKASPVDPAMGNHDPENATDV
jgi:hypothetical protein